MEVGAEGKSVLGGDGGADRRGGERSCVGRGGKDGASLAAFNAISLGGSSALGEDSSSLPSCCFSSSTSSRICCKKASASVSSSSLASSSFDAYRSSGAGSAIGFGLFSRFTSFWLSLAGKARFASARSRFASSISSAFKVYWSSVPSSARSSSIVGDGGETSVSAGPEQLVQLMLKVLLSF